MGNDSGISGSFQMSPLVTIRENHASEGSTPAESGALVALFNELDRRVR